ncbi:single-stranded-DNA-specific exonuclease RecJ [Fructilactobacillus fructivorans]|uniref:single-stranded-DNA-specific exonuclease RecJ n=1 Tax=Fructilactobacillus fructivorans TaxID=1614 RepID=UPI00070517C0|nr:single-stranded-DNA-specific exonuclease RecJ [Fructilactobacillus fructivorans]KRN13683.1 single-stranded-DNA-specific exonuclease RecJ [Fructilactobacillus fructivorans]KRN39615.1 single-stranded-DNA-specific exonuclease RecJ [Fructilactobacillus fructivorans]KRN43335.1 single-stranded-DNA-specific exonuclease RecJ [Fructilactobacillus fructivorans]
MLSSKYNWKLKQNNINGDAVNQLASELGLEPLVVKLMFERGYDDADKIKHYLNPDTSDLNDPFLMHDMQKAVDRIDTAIEKGEQITVYGDYDADGLTSTSILYETLVEMGADVRYYIPNRFKDGYGPNIKAFQKIIDSGTSLIVTVDNGVAGFDAIEEANKLDCNVIITDHHELPQKLPNAYAIVHAQLGKPTYPFQYLSGAGVAFKLATALMDEIPQDKLDLAAIGTVADLVSLTGENRALVQFGLNVIHLTVRPGLKALIKRAGIDLDQVDEQDIGFNIAPRLNALGRMGDANMGVDLLTTVDDDQANELAKKTEKKNDQRKLLVSSITDEAIEQASLPKNRDRETLLIVGKNWHTGVLGIAASRVKDKFHKPTVVVSIDDKNQTAKGSGRSVKGFDLFEALDGERDLMDAFGGHAMAVGLTVPAANLDKLAKQFEQSAANQQVDLTQKPTLKIDFKVTPDEIDQKLFQQIQTLSPFGTDNECPRFDVEPVTLTNVQAIGKSQDHLKFQLVGEHSRIPAIDFGMGETASEVSSLSANVNVAGTLNENEWKGHTNIQLMVDDLKVDGTVVLDKRTTRLTTSMFANDGTYIFFNSKLYQQLKTYVGPHSQALLASNVNKDISDGAVYIVDCPETLDEFKKLVNHLKNPKIILYLYKKNHILSLGMPERSQYAKLFKFVETNKNVKISDNIRSVAQHLQVPANVLVFMLQVFNELGFITIQNGILNGISNPDKQNLSTSPTYQLREEQLKVEDALFNVSPSDLVKIVNGIGN